MLKILSKESKAKLKKMAGLFGPFNSGEALGYGTKRLKKQNQIIFWFFVRKVLGLKIQRVNENTAVIIYL